MKSRYFSLFILSIPLFCLPLTGLMAAPPPKPLSLDTRVATLEAKVAALEALLADVNRGTDDNTGEDTLQFSGMNVQIVSGTGTTWGTPNGTGNLIIGYNETRIEGECAPGPWPCDDRSGSHRLVIGNRNNYSSYGGMVVGSMSEISGPWASVSGGFSNTASGSASSVSGGSGNTASGSSSSVSAGVNNTASDIFSSVSGGYNNDAIEYGSSVSGGDGNTASGLGSSVSGGANNTASGSRSSVSGGWANDASGLVSSVSGGFFNTASGRYDVVIGGDNGSCDDGDGTGDDPSSVACGEGTIDPAD